MSESDANCGHILMRIVELNANADFSSMVIIVRKGES